MGTNFNNIRPLRSVSRKSQAKKERVTVSQPKPVKSYNLFTGSVDHHDLVGKYQIQIRRKKWNWPIVIRIFDMAITNAWILYRTSNGPTALSCLDFRRAVTLSYLKLGCTGTKRKTHTHVVVTGIKYDRINHWFKRRQK